MHNNFSKKFLGHSEKNIRYQTAKKVRSESREGVFFLMFVYKGN